MRSFSVLDYLVEDRVLLLFKFPVSDISGGQPGWPGSKSLCLANLLTIWVRSYSVLSPVRYGHDSIVKYSFDSWVGNLIQILLDFAFRETVIQAT